MANEIIRAKAKKNGVKQWEIAYYLGIGEATLCRWFRKELPYEKQKTILRAIDQISATRSEV